MSPTSTEPTESGRHVLTAALRTMRLIFVESRPSVQLVVALRYIAAVSLTGSFAWSHGPALVSWVTATMAIYLLNGVSDLSGDRANGSTRPLASGRLSESVTRVSIAVCVACSIAVSATVGGTLLVLNLSYLALGVYYSVGPTPAKNSSLATSVVVALGGLMTYAAAHSGSDAHPTVSLIIVALAMSAWMILGSVVKDLPDLEGDKQNGRRTLAVTKGPSAARRAAAVLAVMIVGASGVAVVVAGAAQLWWWVLILAAGGLWLTVTALRKSEPTGPYRAFMTTQQLSHAILVMGI